MDSREFSRLVSKILERNIKTIEQEAGGDEAEPVVLKPLGNRVHVYVGDREFVIVVHSTEPERRWVKTDE